MRRWSLKRSKKQDKWYWILKRVRVLNVGKMIMIKKGKIKFVKNVLIIVLNIGVEYILKRK